MEEFVSESFDGYCPESRLKGRKERMRLNRQDFFESEETGLQIAISYPGVQAVILNFRGNGDFRHTVSYADEVENGEMLSPQTSNRFPFCDGIFKDGDEIKSYIHLIKP
ncbi:MAG: hypothetical protein ACYCZO_02880 [Daejeonella sp.]